MKSKNLLILAAIVLVVAAYVFFFERHQPTSEEARDRAEKVLQDFDRDAVISIEIEGGNGRVRLERTGEEWRLREPLDYPADTSKVSSTLASLANLEADRRLGADEIDPAAYGLDEPDLSVEMRTAEDEVIALVIGDEMPLGSKRALRLGEGGEIVLASGWFVNDLDREVDEWRSREVVDVSVDQVASIDIEASGDHIKAVRVNDEWKLLSPLEDLADPDHLLALVSELDSLRIEEFLSEGVSPADLGLDAPEYEIVLVRSDGLEPLRLDLGATRDGEGGTEVACRRGDSEYFWALDRVRTRLSKAPVLWRAKKVGAFDTWDAAGLVMSRSEATVRLERENGMWRFADDGAEVDQGEVQDRLSKLAGLEATDFDLVAPLTAEMGRIGVALPAGGEEPEAPTLSFTFFEPLTEGGRAMVRVSGRETVMGIDAAAVEAILGDLEGLRAKSAEE